MPFSIVNAEEGLEFVVTVEGQEVASGVDNDGQQGYHGSFTVPDLGDADRTVWVKAVVNCTCGEFPTSQSFYYDAPAAAPTPEPSSAEASSPEPSAPTDGAPVPVPTTEESPAATAAPAPPVSPAGPADDVPRGGPVPVAPSALHGTPQGLSTPGARRGHRAAPVERPTAVSRVEGPIVELPEPTARPESNRDQRMTDASLPARGSSPVRPVPPDISAQARTRPREALRASNETRGVPFAPLGVLLLAGAGLAFWLRRRRGNEPAPPSDIPAPTPEGPDYAVIEAELQEIIAEEKARENSAMAQAP